MTNDELRAAAERLRTYYDTEIRCSPILVFADCETLARAYLAEHPADDNEPVTEAWLRSVGFMTALTKRYCLKRSIVQVCPPCGELGWWMGLKLDSIPGDDPAFPLRSRDEELITRGDVRRLCGAIGIPLRVQTL